MSNPQSPRLRYFFDPLCGWCYASAPAVSAMVEEFGAAFEFMPTGLFTGPGARPLDDAFATHAWTNDQRIGRLTGQPFSERYRDGILARRDITFDSGPLTRAMTAFREVDPALEGAFLHHAQTARYVQGRDTSNPDVLEELASEISGAPDRLAERIIHDAGLTATTNERMKEGKRLHAQSGARGVPALVVSTAAGDHLLHGEALYGGRDRVLAAIDAVVTSTAGGELVRPE